MNHLRQTKVEHSRVGKITRGYASGGAVKGYSDDDSKVRKMSASQEREVNPEGGVAPHRMDRPKRAKGGKVKGNAKTIVNVITGGHPAGGAVPPGPVMPPPGLAGAALPPPPMAAKPPMMPPPGAGGPPIGPGGPPPMPLRAKGGRVNQGDKVYEQSKRAGTQVTHDNGKSDLPDMNRGRQVTFWAGGKVKKRAEGGATKLAGDVVDFPISMQESDARRVSGIKNPAPSRGPAPAPLKGPGAAAKGGRINRASGGRAEASDKVAAASRLPGGSGGGEARLAKAHRAERKG
jgi:hypothetical protein